MLSNEGRYFDRNPNIIPAGKHTAVGDTAKDCMKLPSRVKTPESVQKFRCTTQPTEGKSRIFYGNYNDPDIASLLTHGINTQPSIFAGDLVTPEPKANFRQKLIDKKESIYASRKRAPLGKSHDQRYGLPDGVEPNSQRYGTLTEKDCNASELINPAKTKTEVDAENSNGQHLYKVSHNEYSVGESYDRSYDWSQIPKSSCFGVETPHDNRGTNVKRSLKWLPQQQSDSMPTIVAQRVDQFRERTQPQVGQVHDPIKETLTTSPDHVYGIIVKPDEYGAGDLVHMRFADGYLRGQDRRRGILAAIREHLKKANYYNFSDMKKAFTYYDKDGSGKISAAELKDVCLQFNLPIEAEILQELMTYCDIDQDGQISYEEFANFLNWKEKMSSPCDPEGNDTMRKQIDQSAVDCSTSELLQLANAKVPSKTSTHGVPTIRSDLPAPRIRRIGDNTNYGDESNAYGLINPSLYSNHGVYERDFFKPRQQHEIRRIFDSIGVALTTEAFEEIWNKAQESNERNEVSVESFRHVIDEMVSDAYQQKQERTVASSPQTPVGTHEKPALYKEIDRKLNIKEADTA